MSGARPSRHARKAEQMTPAEHYLAAEELLEEAAESRLGSTEQKFAHTVAAVHAQLATVRPDVEATAWGIQQRRLEVVAS